MRRIVYRVPMSGNQHGKQKPAAEAALSFARDGTITLCGIMLCYMSLVDATPFLFHDNAGGGVASEGVLSSMGTLPWYGSLSSSLVAPGSGSPLRAALRWFDGSIAGPVEVSASPAPGVAMKTPASVGERPPTNATWPLLFNLAESAKVRVGFPSPGTRSPGRAIFTITPFVDRNVPKPSTFTSPVKAICPAELRSEERRVGKEC